MVPLNLAQGKKALYVNTGMWSKKAIAAAKALGNVAAEVIASSAEDNFTYIPEITETIIEMVCLFAYYYEQYHRHCLSKHPASR